MDMIWIFIQLSKNSAAYIHDSIKGRSNETNECHCQNRQYTQESRRKNLQSPHLIALISIIVQLGKAGIHDIWSN